MMDCKLKFIEVFNKKSVNLNIWNLIKFEKLWTCLKFFLKIVFFKIFPQKSYEWMLFQFKKLEKIRLVWLRVILIKRPLKTRNSSFWVKCPFFHVKGPLFSLLIDFFSLTYHIFWKKSTPFAWKNGHFNSRWATRQISQKGMFQVC